MRDAGQGHNLPFHLPEEAVRVRLPLRGPVQGLLARERLALAVLGKDLRKVRNGLRASRAGPRQPPDARPLLDARAGVGDQGHVHAQLRAGRARRIRQQGARPVRLRVDVQAALLLQALEQQAAQLAREVPLRRLCQVDPERGPGPGLREQAGPAVRLHPRARAVPKEQEQVEHRPVRLPQHAKGRICRGDVAQGHASAFSTARVAFSPLRSHALA